MVEYGGMDRPKGGRELRLKKSSIVKIGEVGGTKLEGCDEKGPVEGRIG